MFTASSLFLHRRHRALLPASCAATALLLSSPTPHWAVALWAATALTLVLSLVLGLLSCAWLGEQLPGSGINWRYVGALLGASASLRLVATALRAPRLAATALPVECYAAATLAGLRRHQWPARADALLCVLAMPADGLLQHAFDEELRHAG